MMFFNSTPLPSPRFERGYVPTCQSATADRQALITSSLYLKVRDSAVRQRGAFTHCHHRRVDIMNGSISEQSHHGREHGRVKVLLQRLHALL